MIPGFDPELDENKRFTTAFVLTSPNLSTMLSPILIHNYKIMFRADAHFAFADPLCYPTWFNSAYQHCATIPVPLENRRGDYEFEKYWPDEVKAHLYYPGNPIAVENVASTDKPMFHANDKYLGHMRTVIQRLEIITGELERRGIIQVEHKYTGQSMNQRSFCRKLLMVAKSMVPRAQMPVVREDLCLITSLFARAAVGCCAFYEYWSHYFDSQDFLDQYRDPLPANLNRFGGFVIGCGSTSDFWYRLGYPTRILQPSWDLPADLQIKSIVQLSKWPELIKTTPASPPHEIRWSGPLYNSTAAARAVCPIEISTSIHVWSGAFSFFINAFVCCSKNYFRGIFVSWLTEHSDISSNFL
jgi:hypothetical protein